MWNMILIKEELFSLISAYQICINKEKGEVIEINMLFSKFFIEVDSIKL